MIIWGLRSRGSTLGQRTVNCPNCHRQAMTMFSQSRRWFTLFFIPVFPVSARTTVATCGLCGFRYAVDNQQAAALFNAPTTVAS